MLFVHVMARRYERASTILTSNKGFEDLVVGDEVMATALIDRLLHHDDLRSALRGPIAKGIRH